MASRWWPASPVLPGHNKKRPGLLPRRCQYSGSCHPHNWYLHHKHVYFVAFCATKLVYNATFLLTTGVCGWYDKDAPDCDFMCASVARVHSRGGELFPNSKAGFPFAQWGSAFSVCSLTIFYFFLVSPSTPYMYIFLFSRYIYCTCPLI